jgi:cardiolipin hydrolase
MPSSWQDALKQTLDDHRLSRSERRALKAVIGDLPDDPTVLAKARAYAFELTRDKVAAADQDIVEWLADVTRLLEPELAPSRSSQYGAFFTPGEACLNAIRQELATARRTADICVFTITDDRITREMTRYRKHGVRLRLITDNDKLYDTGSDIRRLAADGIQVHVDDASYHMHHKFAIIDGCRILTGSYNWTRSAATGNHENLIITDDDRMVTAFQAEFESLWTELPRFSE